MGYLTLTNLGAVAGYFGITILTASAVAYALFRWLGSQWISNKLSQQLEAFKGKQQQALEEYKAGHQKALEQLKLNINTIFDRTVKLHVREFDALYEIWEKLNAAFNLTLSFISPIRSSPDIWRMNEDEFQQLLAKHDLTDYERQAIKKADDRSEKYRHIVFFADYRSTNERFRLRTH